MASRLLSLPRELRNEIYGYLLGGNHRFSIAHCYPLGHPMHPMTRKRVDLGTQKSIEITTLRALPGLHREPYLIAYSTVDTPLLCPALLRTCLQIYDEALPVLYAGKTFCYGFEEQGGRPGCPKKPWPCELPSRSVQRIENLRFSTQDHVFEIVKPDKLAEIIASLSKEAYALKRFTLDIQIFIDEDPKAQRHVLLKSIVEDTALIKSIADLKEQMVDIVVSDYEFDGTGWTEDVVTYFGLLVWAIMVATQGACESLGGFMEYFEDEDDDHDEDKSYYEWSWHLRPTLAPPSRRR